MKKFSIVLVSVCISMSLFSQTLFTYGKNETTKAEFLRAYNKNKPATNDRAKAINEYLDLFINFKLKVKAAQDLKLDTIAQIQYDVDNFKEQIAGNYMNDDKGLKSLLEEATDRSLKNVHVLYFSIPVSSGAIPEDTLKAFNASKELYAALAKNNNYDEIIKNIKTKYSAAKYSDVGFITVFSVPYVFENIIFNTKVGSISLPYRSNKAWNIFKVVEERKDIGKWKVAQLLFAFPPNADASIKLNIKKKADSIYTLLQNGLKFDAATKAYSDDRLTYLSGGELPEFSSGKYTVAFENNVINLTKDNEISKPFETAFGYHIVKRISHIALPADKNESSYQYEIKQKVSQDARIASVKEKFARDIAIKTGFKKLAVINNIELYKYVDSAVKSTTSSETFPISKKPIVSFKDGTILKGSDWLSFAKSYKMGGELESAATNEKVFQTFCEQQVSNYYKKHLEEYNQDFKFQMQEFKEGNMLFEIMERKVWSKAGTDSMGLSKYYLSNKEKYTWAKSADVLIFNCSDEKLAGEALKNIKDGKNWAMIGDISNNLVQVDSGRYEMTQIPFDASLKNINSGTFSSIIKNTDGTAIFVKYLKLYDAGMVRSFTEARGLVINDYQSILEQQWINSLKSNYPVKVNEVVLKELVQ
jgi:peptidyl-prolyl cis-trans isomerase SurA